MKKLIILTMIALGISQFAEARNFYRTEFAFGTNYTHIKTGSKDLFSDEVRIVYSDDSAFCYFQYNGTEVACRIIELKSSTDPLIEVPLSVVKSIFVTAAQNTKELNETERGAVKRLINLFPAPLKLSPYSGSVFYQLDDEQPEAIHVFVKDLDSPRRI